jgi:hypothetical protein
MLSPLAQNRLPATFYVFFLLVSVSSEHQHEVVEKIGVISIWSSCDKTRKVRANHALALWMVKILEENANFISQRVKPQ